MRITTTRACGETWQDIVVSSIENVSARRIGEVGETKTFYTVELEDNGLSSAKFFLSPGQATTLADKLRELLPETEDVEESADKSAGTVTVIGVFHPENALSNSAELLEEFAKTWQLTWWSGGVDEEGIFSYNLGQLDVCAAVPHRLLAVLVSQLRQAVNGFWVNGKRMGPKPANKPR